MAFALEETDRLLGLHDEWQKVFPCKPDLLDGVSFSMIEFAFENPCGKNLFANRLWPDME